MSDSPRGRFRVNAGALRADRVDIDLAETRHIRVMRLGAGDHVVLFDGVGEEAVARIETLAVEGATACVVQRYAPATESPLAIWLVQAVPTKLARMALIVRQCTELGMTHLLPVIADHGQLPGGGIGVIRERRERWVRLAEAAAKQSRRSVVPEIGAPVPLQELDWVAMPSIRLVCDPRGGQGTLAQALDGAAHADLYGPATGGNRRGVALMVGPEGGWSADELALAEGARATTVAFGPRVLRADTAGAAALAVIQHGWGDLG